MTKLYIIKTHIFKFLIIATSIICGALSLSAQDKLKFSVADFDTDPFDLSAKDKQYEKYDGNGDRYAIIKITSNNPNDNLSEYNFNFGNMKHIVEEHDGVLWVYVQRNAKLVTITRNGYAPINKYDLHTTIESGKNYVMSLTSEEKKVYAQMVQFNIKPIDSKAVVMVKSQKDNSQETLFGYADANGSIAKSLEYGTYTYKVLADNYHMAEGRFTLKNRLETLVENVDLKPNFSDITFRVDADADIYINGVKKGTRQWTGPLNAGNYQVECRQLNHKTTSRFIQVTENDNRTIELNSPEPILGMVSITSSPLGANILIDGKGYGQTPKNIDILIGEHTAELSKEGYKPEKEVFFVREDRSAHVNISLGKTVRTIINSNPQNAELYIDGSYKGTTPYTYEGELGYYKLRLQDKGYNPFEKKVYLGNSEELSFQLNNSLVKPNDIYIDLGVGTDENAPLNIPIAIGGHFKNINAELYYTYLGVIYYDEKPVYNIGIKLGYGFSFSKRFKVTPQLGYRYTQFEFAPNTYMEFNESASTVTVGVRSFCAFSRHFGMSYTPEYSFGSDLGKGIGMRVALSLTF